MGCQCNKKHEEEELNSGDNINEDLGQDNENKENSKINDTMEKGTSPPSGSFFHNLS